MQGHWIEFDKISGRITMTVENAGYVVTQKFTDFLCLLIAIEPNDTLEQSELVRVNSWTGNQPLSAGKQVSRFLAGIEGRGIDMVSYRQRTNGWRLSDMWRKKLPSDFVRMSKAHAAKIIEALHLGNEQQISTVLKWYQENYAALVAMTTGRARNGYTLLRSTMNTAQDETLFSISNLLVTRIEQRMGTEKLPILSSIKLTADPLMRAIEIRRNAAYALHTKSKDWPKLVKIFKSQLAQISSSGDFTTIAIVRNALSVLYRRMGDLEAAKDQITQAAPLAIFSGDLILIQNIAFNLANIVSEYIRIHPDCAAQDDFLNLLKFDVELRKTMRLGRDSAQTELLLAFLLYEKEDFVEAHFYLKIAKDIIADIGLTTDEALFARITGLLHAAENGDLEQAKMWLEKSEQLYRKIGYLSAALEVKQDMALHT